MDNPANDTPDWKSAVALHAPAMLWGVDASGGTAWVNEPYAALVGWAHPTVPTDAWEAHLHPDDRASVCGVWRDAFAGRRRFDATYRLRGADGAYRWVRDAAQPILRDGRFAGYAGALNDVTDEVNARRDAEERAASFDRMIDRSPIGIVTGTDGLIRHANPAFLQMLGLDPADLPLDWRTITPDDPDYAAADARALAETQTRDFATPYEKAYLHKDGHEVPVLISIVVTDRAAGAGAAFVMDLSDLREREAGRRAAIAESRRVFEYSPVGVFHTTLDGRISDANPAFLRLLGYTRDDLPLNWRDLTPVDDRFADLDRRAAEQLVAEGYFDPIEKAYRHRDGHDVPLLVSGVTVDESTGRYTAFAVDLTARVQAMRALEAERRQTQAIFDHVPAMIWLKDTRNNILRVNALVAELRGLPREQIEGSPSAAIYPESADAFYQDDLEVIRSKQAKLGYAEVIDGELGPQWVRTDKVPVFDADGEVKELLVVATDITTIKQIEAELEARNRDLESLLFVISHDLREPVRSVRVFSEMLESRCGTELSDTARGYVERITRQGKRIQTLLDDIVELCRAQREAAPAEAVDLDALVRAVAADLKPQLELAGGTLDVAGPLPAVDADPRWARRAVENLLGNALKFTRTGEAPRVAVRRYSPETGEPAGVGIEVADDGPGVPAEFAERIFDLFRRGVSSDVPGTGAGLAIVRQVALRHGGNAWVRPTPAGGHGAVFVLTFGRPAGTTTDPPHPSGAPAERANP